MSSQRSTILRSEAASFCQDLIRLTPQELLPRYFTSNSKITEHGPTWCRNRLPFLAKTFSGISGKNSCMSYFEALSQTLKMHMDETTFPDGNGYIVDPDAVVEGESSSGVVCVVGKAFFESVKTGKSWHEQFIYRLSGFDADGKIGHWVDCYPHTYISFAENVDGADFLY